MTDTTHAGEHHGPSFQAYMAIAGALAICTISSFFFNSMARSDPPAISHFTSFVLILGVAIIKAVLVGLVFMHLKWDWKLLYFLIVPSIILGAMMMVVFMPDALLGPSHDRADEFLIRADQEKRLDQQK